MNLKYFHVVESLHMSFVAMVAVVTIATRQTSDTLFQGTYVPNMDLRYSHKAELLNRFLVAMVTVFPLQQGYSLMYYVTKDIFAKYELEILS